MSFYDPNDPNAQPPPQWQPTQGSSQPWQPQQPPPPPPQWTTQPGQWQPSQYAQPTQWQPVPPQQSPRQPGAWQRLSRNGKIGVGCLTVFIAFMLCGFCSGAAHGGFASLSTPVAVVATATTTMQPTATPTHAAIAKRPTPTPRTISKPAPAAQPTVAPKPTMPPAPAPTQPPAGPTYNTDPNGGQLVYNPPADFCGDHACVSTFWTATRGYVVECASGEYSHSGGVSGACSRNGGVAATLYQHG